MRKGFSSGIGRKLISLAAAALIIAGIALATHSHSPGHADAAVKWDVAAR